MKDLYDENTKEEIKEDNRASIPCLWIGRNVKMTTIPKALYRFNMMQIKILMPFFTDIKNTIQKSA